MQLSGITWSGGPIDDAALLEELPPELVWLLRQVNGFILFGGALHVRGAVAEPAWHALRAAWRGPESLASLYPSLAPQDIPFAEDCVGDQFLLRDGAVVRLSAEDAEIEPLGLTLFEFLKAACAEPEDLLSPAPLLRHQDEGGSLEPGMLLHAYPPFCTSEAANGVSLRPVPAQELLRFHAALARQLGALPPGVSFQVRIG